MLSSWSPGDSGNDLRGDSGSVVERKAVEEAGLPLLSLQQGKVVSGACCAHLSGAEGRSAYVDTARCTHGAAARHFCHLGSICSSCKESPLVPPRRCRPLSHPHRLGVSGCPLLPQRRGINVCSSAFSPISCVFNSAFVADGRPSFPAARVRNALMCRHACACP